ncbi:segregation and condensation protein B [Ornithinibacillus bavariensis]|uniref:Phage protein n=1 Tax=Ornithinibacillus bavariensis TaxID=545502 RepID=A0A919XBP2_9BACI|nr:segregation and condensation protein B [Ornithinibacillus bavariensis]GIO27725.1 hypothetical protein J43TS3_23360 [Ornithinibacillus bavariensis]
MFVVDGDNLELRFNMNKIKTVETMHKVSMMSELSQSQGILSFSLLEALFTVGLYNTTKETTIAGKKAQDIFESLLKEEGYGNINAAVVGKLQEDLGFLFR